MFRERSPGNILVVYKQISMRFDEDGNLIPYEGEEPETHTVSYDEKPGIQAIATTSPDLSPREGNGVTYRDYEYVRHGTLSLLAGIDLVTGEAIPLVRETHKSSDFIEFLKILDSKYPKGDKIRLVLDNHSAHTSYDKLRSWKMDCRRTAKRCRPGKIWSPCVRPSVRGFNRGIRARILEGNIEELSAVLLGV